MKKAGKIALAVAGVVLVAGAVTVAVQWNNIKALSYMMTMDTGTLSQRAEENRKTLDKAMEDYQIPTYTFSEEEMAQLASGELSEEEAASRLLGQSGSGETETAEEPEPSQSQAPSESPSASQTPSASQSAAPSQSPAQSGDNSTQEAEAELRQLVATMYVLQATYEGKLEAIVQEAIDEYTAGEHTSENRTKIVYSKYDALTKLEKECDQKVADIVARMRELLKATGQSESLADEVQKTYEEEKSLKKAYYIREFQEG
ncbi:proline-rich domain-containing protein [uncultured Pseudoflavonifractor sp.]|uniref:proline-rich domain-containing protein n=1 Tax=uncultured Pseudoflavonifractor sp. TaxID=1221379 RepID=UPI0025F52546|nr:proline-rich domain-containing protein [uncultured Pseudoflavonifractor sp.]